MLSRLRDVLRYDGAELDRECRALAGAIMVVASALGPGTVGLAFDAGIGLEAISLGFALAELNLEARNIFGTGHDEFQDYGDGVVTQVNSYAQGARFSAGSPPSGAPPARCWTTSARSCRSRVRRSTASGRCSPTPCR